MKIVTLFESSYMAFLYDHSIELLVNREREEYYTPIAFWQLIKHARKECIKIKCEYKITQVEKESLNGNIPHTIR